MTYKCVRSSSCLSRSRNFSFVSDHVCTLAFGFSLIPSGLWRSGKVSSAFAVFVLFGEGSAVACAFSLPFSLDSMSGATGASEDGGEVLIHRSRYDCRAATRVGRREARADRMSFYQEEGDQRRPRELRERRARWRSRALRRVVFRAGSGELTVWRVAKLSSNHWQSRSSLSAQSILYLTLCELNSAALSLESTGIVGCHH